MLAQRLLMLAALAGGLLALPWVAANGTAETSEGGGAARVGASRLALGASHSCAINPAGAVYCWGANTRGSLGMGDGAVIGDNETPAAAGSVKLGPGRKATAIAAGSSHTCALLDNGLVKCWGRNDAGQLGLGNTEDVGDNETPADVPAVNLGAGRFAVAITAGGQHTCAVLDDGSVRCWGDNSLAQLGTSNGAIIGDDEVPGNTPVVDLGGAAVQAISAGSGHTCVIVVGGTLRCWGYAANGQLGLGFLPAVSAPGGGPISGGGGGNTGGGSPGADSGDGPVIGPPGVDCNDLPPGLGAECDPFGGGNTGGGTTGGGGDGSPTGGIIAIGDNESPASVPAVFVGDDVTTIAVSAGAFHTCALLSDGSVRCWGLNRGGATGQGTFGTIGDDEAPGAANAIDLGENRTAVAISAGYAHSCAVLDNGTLTCWGSNDTGQLGRGDTEAIGDDETPGSVNAIPLGDGRSVLAVATGGGRRIPAGSTTPQAGEHTCALLDNGTLRCWGGNESGQLGLASTADLGDDEAVLTAANVAVPGMLGAEQGLGSTGRFTPQVPVRIVDTRDGLGVPAPGQLGPNRTLKFSAADPADNVVAVALNVTVIAPDGANFIGLAPAGEPEPLVSNINTSAGKIVANLVIVKVSPDGMVNLFNSPTRTHIVVDKLGEYRVGEGAAFSPIAPQRLDDSRTDGVPIGANTTRTVQVAGVQGIPAGATSVVLNVVGTQPTAAGYLTVYPKGAARPVASSLNFEPGDTVSNLVIAQVGADGSVEIYNPAGTTHVVVDALGWFGPDATGGALSAVTPARLVDTRVTGPDAGQFSIVRETTGGSTTETCKVIAQVTGIKGIPADATGVVLNVVVVGPPGPGYLNVSKDGANPTATSNINFSDRTVANAVLTDVSAAGTVVVSNPTGCADVVIDVFGYFGGSAPVS